MSEKLELHDIQGVLLRGYGDLKYAAYLCLRVDDAGKARAWLRDTLSQLTSAHQVSDKRSRPRTRKNLAFTWPGLGALGASGDLLASFPDEIIGGMAHPDRARVLGDEGTSAAAGWHFGAERPATLHALYLVYAEDPEALRGLEKQERERLHGAFTVTHIERSTPRPENTEHFGFADGIAQPMVQGDREPLTPGQPIVAAGEFVLGYENDYEQQPWSPSVADDARAKRHGLARCRAAGPHPETRTRADLGRNGSFLVLRKLEQDVDGFWDYFRKRAAEIVAPADVGDAATWLAAKSVGRWPSGAPLVLAPHHDDPRAAHPMRRDNFGYKDDPDGLRCPFGSHIRRANPRDSLDRAGGGSISKVSPRRLLRRGRTYVDGDTADGAKQCGVLFVALCANVRRQFEFIQQTWLGNRRFATLDQDPDPLVGGGAPGDGITIPAQPFRYRLPELPRFVTVRGGGYFFLPGLRALAYLADA